MHTLTYTIEPGTEVVDDLSRKGEVIGHAASPGNSAGYALVEFYGWGRIVRVLETNLTVAED